MNEQLMAVAKPEVLQAANCPLLLTYHGTAVVPYQQEALIT